MLRSVLAASLVLLLGLTLGPLERSPAQTAAAHPAPRHWSPASQPPTPGSRWKPPQKAPVLPPWPTMKQRPPLPPAWWWPW